MTYNLGCGTALVHHLVIHFLHLNQYIFNRTKTSNILREKLKLGLAVELPRGDGGCFMFFFVADPLSSMLGSINLN